MSDFIGDLRRDLEERLKEVERELDGRRAAAARARAAAGGAGDAAVRDAPSARPATKGHQRAQERTRAPRGANREAILSVVGERPGVSAAEIADVTKISRAVTYNTLAKLVEQGRLAKTELPGGQTGYKAASTASGL